jgi:hypothetical protein
MKILLEKNKTDSIKEDHAQMDFSHSKFCLKSKGNLTWLHIMAFVDYKKAFDKVNRVKLFEILHNDRVPQQIITKIFSTYENNMISIKVNN